MPVSETLQSQGTSPDHLTPDPNVTIPAHVREAAAAADAIHKQVYEQPAPAEQQAPPAEQQQAPVEQQAPPVEQQAPTEQAAPAPDFTAPADVQSLQDSEWARRYNSMRGRYEASERARAGMEEQMRQLGAELVRTQALLQQPQVAQTPTVNHGNLITEEDRANYGDELIDLSRRAALSAVTPELQQLRAENQRLTQRVSSTSKRELFASLDGAVPNWRAVNKSTQFKSWLALPNIYTGQIRQQMLTAAVDGAEAPKVIALFRDFLTEANATGQTAPAAQIEQQAPQAAPRTPALDLETLAAPGRARPAPGDSQVPVEKPIYTRAQISKFYDDSRKGLYAGREAEYRATEADMQQAQREGRIR